MKGQIEKIRQYIEAEIQESVETEQNKYLRILKKANPHDLEWMNEYGKEVTESEKETAVFYFSYPKEKICRMAEHITDAFFHGLSAKTESAEKGKGFVCFIGSVRKPSQYKLHTASKKKDYCRL